MKKYFEYLLFIAIFSCFILFLLINRSQIFYELNNNKDIPNNYIPNIIHYIIFDKITINFSGYLSVLSCIKFQKPTAIYLHTNQIYLKGDNWDKIKQLNKTRPIIVLNYISKPTHVYGQLISSNYHASDVARINILKELGGIYLDTDTVILKNLNEFRHYEMVVGWPQNEYLGTQILLARKNAKFLKLWLEGYKRYIPTNWYYNAGQYPTEQILEKMPQLAHRVPELFGVQNLLNELYINTNWTKWKEYYSIHLLSRHSPAPKYLNESLINEMNNTFKDIAKYILYA